MPRANPQRNSEVDAYVFIKENLETLGWNPKNPSRNPEGQVYTQNEYQSHPEMKRCLGRNTPENIVKLSENIFWVIEAKKEHRQLQQALQEAQDYAKQINQSSQIKAIIASGVAGNRTDSYLIENAYFDGARWKKITINGKKASGLLKPDEVRIILSQRSPDIKDVIIDEKLFLRKAENINKILHLGAINKNYRARVMAALLLSLIDETPPNIDASPRGLIRDINSRVQNVLETEGKPEFYEQINITLPPSPDNHVKFKKALVDTMQELNILNIRSAMNSGADVLGKFYEVFLKYGNGAKEIGIVLTPRHITKFTVNVLNVNLNDIVFDPTCGTGGFLVAAFDYIKQNANQSQINRFKVNNIFGIEQEPEVVALAIVNMIFRGDGKNNIIEGNCFQKSLAAKVKKGISTADYNNNYQNGQQAVTKVLMNPPFALKDSDDKEYKFVDYALKQMQDGGILFSVLPISVMIEDNAKIWRKENLLSNNTLLSVLTFPEDLFYPIGVHTLGIFVKKGIPHPRKQNVLWIRALNDGYLKKKGKRLENERAQNDYPTILPILQSFIINQTNTVKNIPEFQKACPIDFSDEELELVPEAYLDDRRPSQVDIEQSVESLMRETVAFLIKNKESIKE